MVTDLPRTEERNSLFRNTSNIKGTNKVKSIKYPRDIRLDNLNNVMNIKKLLVHIKYIDKYSSR